MEILSQTPTYFVINKPPGYSVEDSEQFPSGEKFMQKRGFGGLSVHRLDVETSGVLIWAKNQQAKHHLQTLWQGRAVKKTYLALVVGEAPKAGEIEQAIERDTRKDRQRVSLLPSSKSRTAITHYKRLSVGEWGRKKVSLVECQPITGRTHQIRVHLQAIGHPIVGDRLYGNKEARGLAKTLGVERQLLHAWKLKLPNVAEYTADPPADFCRVLKALSLRLSD